MKKKISVFGKKNLIIEEENRKCMFNIFGIYNIWTNMEHVLFTKHEKNPAIKMKFMTIRLREDL